MQKGSEMKQAPVRRSPSRPKLRPPVVTCSTLISRLTVGFTQPSSYWRQDEHPVDRPDTIDCRRTRDRRNDLRFLRCPDRKEPEQPRRSRRKRQLCDREG